MKLIYLTTSIDDLSAGVKNKINTQISVMNQNGIDVELFNPMYKGHFRNFIKYFFTFIGRNKKIEDLKRKAVEADCVYIRYFLCNYSVIKFLKTIKIINPKLKVLVEIPTYPYEREMKGKKLTLLIDRLFRLFLKKYVNKIVTFSSDKYIYGIPTINVSNGVDTSCIDIKKILTNNDSTINIIVVACFSFWHGFDRIISGLHQYYSTGGRSNYIVHFVGNGDDRVINQYKKMVEKYHLHENIIFYGEKKGKELDDIYNICDLAFDSLGRHRSGVFYNSTLKGKEYLAKGLPIISGVETELDNIKSFQYYFRVPADETPIDFNDIYIYYKKIYDNINRQCVVNEIRHFCEQHFDIKTTIKKIIDEILK